MTATADMIIERRKIRRSRAFWRILAIVAVVVAIIAVVPSFTGGPGAHIARVTINDVIFFDAKREQAILRLAGDKDVKAVVIEVNSPGGTLVGSEALYQAIRQVAAKKPVVAVMQEYAASGGYITAIAAEHIVARRNTITGSIGVVMQAPNITGLLKKLGIEVNQIKSAPLKAEPSLTSPLTPEALKAQQELIDDAFDWFKKLVSKRRGITGEALARVSDGRAFTGRQALQLKLIDRIGSERDALDWLRKERKVASGLAVRQVRWKTGNNIWPFGEIGGIGRVLQRPESAMIAVPRLFAIVQ